MTSLFIKGRMKLLVGSFLFFFVAVGLYFRASWKYEEDGIVRSIDARLQLAAETIPLLLAPDFHDRALGPGSISLKEELLNRMRINTFVRNSGLRYAQTLVKFGDEFYFSAPTVTKEEERERESWYFYPYDDIPEEFRQSYDTGRTVYLSYSDHWGSYRSICRPMLSAGGIRHYLVVVDISTDSVQGLLHRGWRRSVLTILFLFLSVLPLGYTLWRLTADLKKSEADRHRAELDYLTYHDLPTSLPNRAGFLLKMRETAERYQVLPAVLVLVVRDFKRINEAVGMEMGDEILRMLSDRLQGMLLHGEVLARLGGVEFAVGSNMVADEYTGYRAGERFLNALKAPFVAAENEFYLTGNVGIMLPSSDKNAEESLSCAAIAAIEAKRIGRGRILLYDERLQARTLQIVELERFLRTAIREKSFTVYFQPIVDVRSKKIRGVEALARWFLLDGRAISPADFIPLAETTGLIVPLSEILFELTGEGFIRLREENPELFLSLNISPILFEDNAVETMLILHLEKAGVSPENVVLEITETAFISDMENCRAALERLAKRGYLIAIDDFGVGNSSISYLQNFPIGKLKIDQSFIRGLEASDADWTLIRAILRMSEVLGIDVVAEGVETLRQEEILEELNCPMAQGFRYYRPMNADNCLAAVRAAL